MQVIENHRFLLLLGALGPLLAALGPLLGRSWRLLAALGRSWAALGCILAALGRLCCHKSLQRASGPALGPLQDALGPEFASFVLIFACFFLCVFAQKRHCVKCLCQYILHTDAQDPLPRG